MNILTQNRGIHNMKKGSVIIITLLAFAIVFFGVLYAIHYDTEHFPELTALPIEEAEKIEHLERPVEKIEITAAVPTDEELMARVVMAEAEGEEMIGKVAVATTILNRCDYYGITVETAVYTDKQYSIADTYNDECMRAVEIAKETRDLFPDTMMWFRTDHYHDFGNGTLNDYLPIGNHYFSTLNKGDSK